MRLTSAGSRSDVSTGGFGSSGSSTPGSLVHGKFSIHEACAPSSSIARTIAITRSLFHQSWYRTRASGCSAPHSDAAIRAGVFPPCPLTIRIRRNPCPDSDSSKSVTTARNVSTRSVGLPG
jgi:hypothetical protein